MSALRPILAALAEGRALSEAEALAAFSAIMDGEAEEAQIGGFLMALRLRGETIAEITAGARALRARALTVAAPPEAIDTCGTGGDGAGTFNISTAAALVAAGAGAVVAKHGNRAVSSKSGSAEVLAALGVNVEATPQVVARCLKEAGVGFLFAPSHHAAMRRVAAARRALGLRTIFNMIGPLANPAGARRQLLGVYDRGLVRPMAEALLALGAERAWVVHGSDGLDELTTTGPSHAAILADGVIEERTITPEEAGLARARPEALRGGDPSANAAAITALLAGAPGAFRDIVVLNAAAALVAAGRAGELAQGAALARQAIDSGAAKQALAVLVAVSNEPVA